MAKRTRRNVEFDEDDLDWYQSTYPDMPLSVPIGMLLKHFRQAHILTPDDYAKIGAAHLHKLLDESE
jgi:hypothetical protein